MPSGPRAHQRIARADRIRPSIPELPLIVRSARPHAICPPHCDRPLGERDALGAPRASVKQKGRSKLSTPTPSEVLRWSQGIMLQ